MTSRRARLRTRDIVIGVVLLAGLVVGVVLVVTGGPDDEDGSGGDEPTATLPVGDVSMEAVEEWSGLDVPDDAEGFLTARIGDSQLDVTFTMASGDEAGFVADSGLPEPVAGERQVLHSSPLWRLNPGSGPDEAAGSTGSTGSTGTTDTSVLDEDPDPGAEAVPDVSVRSTADTYEGIRRAVELVDEGAGTVRARVVLTAA